MNMPTLPKDNLLLQAPPAAAEPSVALVFPFDPKMTPKADLDLSIKRLLGTAEKQLLTRYPGDMAMPVIKRLQQALRGLNYSTHKRSAAVWVSATKMGTTYMDFAVEERLFVDQSFRVRDLADCKPTGKECLLLLLSGKESRMYLRNGSGLKLIKTNGAQNIFAYLNEVPQRTANFSDPAERARMEAQLQELGRIRVPSRSSYFGIIDLCGFKKDRFYIHQARWRPELPMAHILPHWNWPERVGQVTPVHVYTSGDEAELFLNGKSLGRKKKGEFEYRLRWDDVVYEPGELKVVAYKNGKKWAEETVKTADAPARLEASADRKTITADGADLSFVTVRVAAVAPETAPPVEDGEDGDED